mmetsp:Transcript_91268/g.295213  ORF Transcript_91268/g.295213 Transcript_91268/m.295213 type:complete len:281 (-) Transcript_91268:629-1471(-)
MISSLAPQTARLQSTMARRSSLCAGASAACESSETVILFSVRVPVLSDAMTLTEPKVSTTPRFFTRTLLLDMSAAMSAKVTVTATGMPSGTNATIREMQFTIWEFKARKSGCLTRSQANHPRKATIPVLRESTAMMMTKRLISWWSVDGSELCEPAMRAMSPKTVLFPVAITTPTPVPSTALHPKNARFFVSRKLLSEHCRQHFTGSLSPFSVDLSTLRSLTEISRTSAGTLSPPLIVTMSPTTRSDTGTDTCWPPRLTIASRGIMAVNCSMMQSLLYSW